VFAVEVHVCCVCVVEIKVVVCVCCGDTGRVLWRYRCAVCAVEIQKVCCGTGFSDSVRYSALACHEAPSMVRPWRINRHLAGRPHFAHPRTLPEFRRPSAAVRGDRQA
jgi:hypothetical protein